MTLKYRSIQGGKKEVKPKEDEATLALMKQQQQIAAKNELRRRMEDEAKISKVNSMKIVNQWRKIMRIAKTESLKKDIEILSQNHERDVDRKDAILQMLDRYAFYLFSLPLNLYLSFAYIFCQSFAEI